MVGYRVQAGANNPGAVSLTARYLYGSDGMRVKKWVRNQQGQVTTTTYIDGIFEQHTFTSASENKTNNTLHVMDDQSRVALVRVGQALDERDVSPHVQYHLGDHLGSSHLVVGGENSSGSQFINREEYFPYGETSFGSFGRKRYRYSGKERDEESGLYYYGARFYAPWLARWVACDPAGIIDGYNLYVFVKNRPLILRDAVGLQSQGNPGERIGEELINNTRYARYRAIKGTWVSASARNEHTGYPQESAYGAYHDIVFGDDLNPLPNPDLIEPGDEYLIPIQSESVLETFSEPHKPPKYSASDNLIDARCDVLTACIARVGMDKQMSEGPFKRIEWSKMEIGYEGGEAKAEARMARVTGRTPIGEVQGELMSAEAHAKISYDREGTDGWVPTSLDAGIGAMATAVGGEATLGSSDNNVTGGLSLSVGAGANVMVGRLSTGQLRYSADLSILFYKVGVTITTDEKSASK